MATTLWTTWPWSITLAMGEKFFRWASCSQNCIALPPIVQSVECGKLLQNIKKRGSPVNKYFVSIVILICCISCTTVGNKFDPQVVNQLKPNISTIDEATGLMGPPMAQSAMPGGNTLYQWQYAQGTIVGGSGAHVAILFDPNGVMLRVQHMSSTSM